MPVKQTYYKGMDKKESPREFKVLWGFYFVMCTVSFGALTYFIYNLIV